MKYKITSKKSTIITKDTESLTHISDIDFNLKAIIKYKSIITVF